MPEQTIKKRAPAYSTYKTLMTFIDGLSPAMPTLIDRSIMRKMSGSAQAATLSSLRFLKLVDENDSPTELLRSLAGSDGEERQAALQEMVEGAYGMFTTLDLSTATPGQVEDWFKDQGVRGATVSRAFAFFISAADDAGISLSKHLHDHRPKRATSNSNGSSPNRRNTGASKKRVPPKPKSQDLPLVPKGSTKFDVPIPGTTKNASLILPDDLSEEDWAMLKQMFDLYAVRHIAATDASGGSE